ncbi:alkene reductase [bacterium]|nr:MAG: alkene reductase [bacterium]
MAPMTRSRAINNLPNELMVEYYEQRSSAGLIITEGVAPSINGLGYARIPGLYSDEQVEGWKKITDAVHKNGSKIFVQLMHTGRIASKPNMPEGAKVIAPSAIQAKGQMWTDAQGMLEHDVPEEMSIEDIKNTIAEYVKASENAIKAGFDGIELHAASGYLPNQFLSTNANLRTDQYGGSVENRSRFVLETLTAIGNSIGFDKLGIKLSPGMAFNDIEVNDADTIFPYLVEQLNSLNLAYLHVMRTQTFDAIGTFRDTYKGSFLIGAGFDRDSGEEVLTANKADMVVYGTLYISNPDLPKRFETGSELNKSDQATYYGAGAEGYIDYPFLGE